MLQNNNTRYKHDFCRPVTVFSTYVFRCQLMVSAGLIESNGLYIILTLLIVYDNDNKTNFNCNYFNLVNSV